MVHPSVPTGVDDSVWQPARTHVLVVGITVWPARAELPASVELRRDADLAAQFKAAGVPARNVLLLQDSAATRAGVRKALRELASRSGPDGTFVFCFLGHGGRELLYCYDYDEMRPDETVFHMSEIHPILEQSWRGSRLILIGDFCCSGSLGAVLRQFRNHRPGVRVAVLASATESGDSTNRWTFTEGLMRILAGDPLVDRDEHGRITIAEAGRFLHQRMMNQENQLASFMLSANFEREFVIRSAPARAAVRQFRGVHEAHEAGPPAPPAGGPPRHWAAEVHFPRGFPGNLQSRCSLPVSMSDETDTAGASAGAAQGSPPSTPSRWRGFWARLGVLPRGEDPKQPPPPADKPAGDPGQACELSDGDLEQVSGGLARLEDSSFRGKGRGGF